MKDRLARLRPCLQPDGRSQAELLSPLQGRRGLPERPFNQTLGAGPVTLEQGQASLLREDANGLVARSLGQECFGGLEAKGSIPSTSRALIKQCDGGGQLSQPQAHLVVRREESVPGLIRQKAAAVQSPGLVGRMGRLEKGMAFTETVAGGAVEAGGLFSPLLGPMEATQPLEGTGLGVEEDGVEALLLAAPAAAPGPTGLAEAPDGFRCGGRLGHQEAQLPKGPCRLPKLARSAVALHTRPQEFQRFLQAALEVPAPAQSSNPMPRWSQGRIWLPGARKAGKDYPGGFLLAPEGQGDAGEDPVRPGWITGYQRLDEGPPVWQPS